MWGCILFSIVEITKTEAQGEFRRLNVENLQKYLESDQE